MSILSHQIVDPIQLYSLELSDEQRLVIVESGAFPEIGKSPLRDAVPDFRVRYSFNYTIPGITLEIHILMTVSLPPLDFSNPDHLTIKGVKAYSLYNTELTRVFTCTAGTYTVPSSLLKIGEIHFTFTNPQATQLYQGMNMNWFRDSSLDPSSPAPPFPSYKIIANPTVGPIPYFGEVIAVEPTYNTSAPYPVFNLYHIFRSTPTTYKIPSGTFSASSQFYSALGIVS